jgi:hypothetical protein
MADLRNRGITSKVRSLKTGEGIDGIPFTRGPLAYLLRNRFYIGDVVFKGEVLQGEQPPIVDRSLFDAVQAKLEEQNTRAKSEALLAGRIFDDRGNRMSPSHARKRGIKYRYYLSSALLDGRPTKAGSVSRVPAAEIETVVVKAVQEHLKLEEPHEPGSIVKTHVTRVKVQADQLTIQLASSQKRKRGRPSPDNIIRVRWRKAPPRRRREVLQLC